MVARLLADPKRVKPYELNYNLDKETRQRLQIYILTGVYDEAVAVFGEPCGSYLKALIQTVSEGRSRYPDEYQISDKMFIKKEYKTTVEAIRDLYNLNLATETEEVKHLEKITYKFLHSFSLLINRNFYPMFDYHLLANQLAWLDD